MVTRENRVIEGWPQSKDELERAQVDLALMTREAPAWKFPAGQPVAVGAAFIAYRRGRYGVGAAGDEAWAAATIFEDGKRIAVSTVSGTVGAPYIAGYLALREGPLLERAVRGLTSRADILLLDATGLDHPRRAGLAIHLGAVLDLPTVGVTDRTLLAQVSQPDQGRGAMAPMTIDGEIVGCVLRTQDRVKPVLVHAGWMTDPRTACQVVLAVTEKVRTPEPLREARRVAKDLRARSS
jgi:deoxyribonuclease V